MTAMSQMYTCSFHYLKVMKVSLCEETIAFLRFIALARYSVKPTPIDKSSSDGYSIYIGYFVRFYSTSSGVEHTDYGLGII